MKTRRLQNTHPHFQALVQLLDEELNTRYGNQQAQYDKHNKIEPLDTALVGYWGDEPVACGCFKPYDDKTIEIKRMFVRSEHRRKGFSSILLRKLEQWGQELGFRYSILETGNKQPEAVNLYNRFDYQIIENYGPYRDLPNSICLKKKI